MTKKDKVKVTVIDDRVRVFLDPCPFKGQWTGPTRDRAARRECNVNQTSSPICVGVDHEDCLLNDYDKFIVERV